MTTSKHVSGTIKARADLIRDALRFAYLAAGEGIDIEGLAPEDFLMAYSEATGDEDWDTFADRLAAIQPYPELHPVAWPEGFFRIPAGGDARLRECATDGCYQHVSIRVERGVIGSDYCEPCARKIADQFMPATPSSAGLVSVEAAARVLLDDHSALERIARAYDSEDAALIGEPDPWLVDDKAPDWEADRVSCARAALSALAGSVDER